MKEVCFIVDLKRGIGFGLVVLKKNEVIPSKVNITVNRAKKQKEAAYHLEEAWIRVTEARVLWLLESFRGCMGVCQGSNPLNQAPSSFV